MHSSYQKLFQTSIFGWRHNTVFSLLILLLFLLWMLLLRVWSGWRAQVLFSLKHISYINKSMPHSGSPLNHSVLYNIVFLLSPGQQRISRSLWGQSRAGYWWKPLPRAHRSHSKTWSQWCCFTKWFQVSQSYLWLICINWISPGFCTEYKWNLSPVITVQTATWTQ